MATNFKKYISVIFKICLGVGLIIYLINSGYLNLQLIIEAINSHPWWFLFATCLLFIPVLLTSYRWWLLLLAQDTKISFSKTISLNFIGLFFNLCLPGGTGGDLAKCYYIASIYPDKKTATITTVLIDRFLGLSGLVLVGSISILLNPKISYFAKGPIKIISTTILLLSAGMLIGLVLFLNFPISFIDLYPEKISHLPGGKLIQKFYHAVRIYRNHQSVIYVSLFLSTLVHTTIIIMTIIFGRISGASLSWGFYGVITPLGLLANSLPISPAGLGVGEAVFEYFYNQVNCSLGGEIMALFHLVHIFWGFLGLPFYLLFKKKPKSLPDLEVEGLL